jgi:hypothetical protein
VGDLLSVFGALSDPTVVTAAGASAIVAGIWLLRSSWLANSETKPRSVVVSLLLILCGLLIFTQPLDAEVGIAYGLLTFSLAGYAVVAATIELRGQKNRIALAGALEPEVRRTNWPRAIAKSYSPLSWQELHRSVSALHSQLQCRWEHMIASLSEACSSRFCGAQVWLGRSRIPNSCAQRRC